MFSLPESEFSKVKRVYAKAPTELELRISAPGAFSNEKAVYDRVFAWLYQRKSSYSLKRYDNYNYVSRQGETIRLTRQDGVEDVYISKTKIPRKEAELDVSFPLFRVRIGEALETPFYGDPSSLGLKSIRKITRHDILVDGVHFELSEVVMGQEFSLEIEVELPVANPRDVAVKALNLLVQASLAEYDPFPGYFVKTIEEVKRDMDAIRNLAGFPADRVAVNPINLKRVDFGNLDKYALTNKLDGERKFVVHLRPGELLVMGSKGYQPANPSSVYYIRLGQEVLKPFILDTEYYKKRFYVFDVAVYDVNKPDSDLPHQQRMGSISDVTAQLPFLQPKTFYYQTFQQNLEQFMAENPAERWFHSADGLILTETTGSYKKTSHLKYKFYSKMSIDFRLANARKEGFRFVYDLHVYDSRLRDRNPEVVFTVDKQPQRLYSSKFYSPVVAECILYQGEWVVLRLREDKPVPNALMTAESVFQDIVSPILFSDLVDDKKKYRDYIKVIQRLELSFLADELSEKGTLIQKLAESNAQALCTRACNVFGFNPSQCGPDTEARLAQVVNRRQEEVVYNLSLITQRGYFPNGHQAENKILGDFIQANQIIEFLDAKSMLLYKNFQAYTQANVIPKNAGLVYHQVPRSGEITLAPFPENILTASPEYTKYQAAWKGQECMSKYSSLMPWHKEQVSAVLKKWIAPRARVADLTAHVGIDVVHLKQILPETSVTAFEIDPVIADALAANTRGLGVNVQQRDSCFTIYMTPANTYDVVYIDAPWGGPDYKKEKELELYMDKEGAPKLEARNVKNVARYVLAQRIANSVILKVPSNFSMNLPGLKVEAVVDITNNGKISYKLILLTPGYLQPLVGGQLLVWSTPYCDFHDVVFAGGQPHLLVRVPTHRVYDTAVMKFMQWLYPYRGTTPESLINEEELLAKAQQYKYYFISRMVVDEVAYVYFSREPKAMFQLAPAQAQQPQAQPRAPVLVSPRQQAPPKKEEKRVYGSMYYMRKYHNVEKNVLIQLFCKNRSVLDLGAGKGGDLSKYSDAGVTRLVLIDPSQENLQSEDGLFARLKDMKVQDRTTVLHAYGQETMRIFTEVMRESRVQVVSSFFSMTFLFESITNLREFLATVDSCLVEGGYFIGTMMDGDKSHTAFAGKQQLVYDDVTIVKHYSDEAEHQPGNKLYINIQDSIVKNQNEYLAYFPVLRAELEKLGFQLELRYDFNPDTYAEKDKMTPETRDFSKLNIGFVFRKMPKKISGSISILEEDESQEFFNLYGELNTLYRTGVAADGSCFYHSYLMSTDSKYLSASKKKRQEMMEKLRTNFSEAITLETYLRLLPLQLHEKLESALEQDQAYQQEVGRQYDESKTPRQLAEYLKKNPEAGDKIIRKLKRSVASPEKWADDTHLILFMEYTDSNIYLLSTTTRQPVELLMPYYKTSRRVSMMLLSHPDYHFEPVFIGVWQTVGGQKRLYAKRSLHRMDPQLIYLHQWLLKKLK